MSEESRQSPFARYLLGTQHADAVILLVVGGDLGGGCARAEMPKADPEVTAKLRAAQVKLLRHLADDIEKGITQPDQPWARRWST